jgi:hypothetical protein
MKQKSTQHVTRQSDGKWISDSLCRFAGTPIVGYSVTTASGDAAFHTEGTTNADAKWLGDRISPGRSPAC